MTCERHSITSSTWQQSRSEIKCSVDSEGSDGSEIGTCPKGAFGWYDLEQDSPEQHVRLGLHMSWVDQNMFCLQTEQLHFFAVKPGRNIDFGPK